MSLKTLHIFFVGLSSLLCVGFGAWCLFAGGGYLGVGCVSLLSAGALIFYGVRFLEKFKQVPFLLFAFCLLPFDISPAHACAACYGDPASLMTHGMNMAILFMVGVTVLVLSGFVGFFFVYFNKTASGSTGSSGPAVQAEPEEGDLNHG